MSRQQQYSCRLFFQVLKLELGCFYFIRTAVLRVSGICCGEGQGSYSVKINTVVVATGGQFTTSQATSFALIPSWQTTVSAGSTSTVTASLTIPAGQVAGIVSGPTFSLTSPVSNVLSGSTVASITALCGMVPSTSPAPSVSPSLTPSVSLSASLTSSQSITASISITPSVSPPCLPLAPSLTVAAPAPVLGSDVTSATIPLTLQVKNNNAVSGGCSPVKLTTFASSLPSGWTLNGLAACSVVSVAIVTDA